MLFYAAIVLALAVTCVAGVQFFYLMFMQTASRQDRRRIRELERELALTREELEATAQELELAEQELHAVRQQQQDDVWPEIIDS